MLNFKGMSVVTDMGWTGPPRLGYNPVWEINQILNVHGPENVEIVIGGEEVVRLAACCEDTGEVIREYLIEEPWSHYERMGDVWGLFSK